MTCLVPFVPSESVSESETGRTRCTLVFTGAAEDGKLSSGNIRLSARYIAFPVLIFSRANRFSFAPYKRWVLQNCLQISSTFCTAYFDTYGAFIVYRLSGR